VAVGRGGAKVNECKATVNLAEEPTLPGGVPGDIAPFQPFASTATAPLEAAATKTTNALCDAIRDGIESNGAAELMANDGSTAAANGAYSSRLHCHCT